jgi:predicted DNA binding protein
MLSMRKIVVELSESEIQKLPNSPINMVKSNEFLRILRFDNKEFAAVIRIVFKDVSFRIEDLLSYTGLTNAKVELLEQDKDGGFIYFVNGELPQNTKQQKLASFGGYLLTPLEIVDGKIRMTFIGKPKQLKALLKTCEDIGLKYKVVLISEATFSPNAPLLILTQKQREVLVASFREGYYDIPRRIESRELAAKLGLKSSTLIEHRRKAERRLIASIINES